jgi:hypothetical protein
MLQILLTCILKISYKSPPGVLVHFILFPTIDSSTSPRQFYCAKNIFFNRRHIYQELGIIGRALGLPLVLLRRGFRPAVSEVKQRPVKPTFLPILLFQQFSLKEKVFSKNRI